MLTLSQVLQIATSRTIQANTCGKSNMICIVEGGDMSLHAACPGALPTSPDSHIDHFRVRLFSIHDMIA